MSVCIAPEWQLSAVSHHGKTPHRSLFSSPTLGLCVCSRQQACPAALCSLCLLAASPSWPCPWQDLSPLHPGGLTSARQQQPGQGRQVRLSWLPNLCKATPAIQILYGNRALPTSLSTKPWALQSHVYVLSERRGYARLQDTTGQRQPWHSLPQCFLCLPQTSIQVRPQLLQNLFAPT